MLNPSNNTSTTEWLGKRAARAAELRHNWVEVFQGRLGCRKRAVALLIIYTDGVTEAANSVERRR